MEEECMLCGGSRSVAAEATRLRKLLIDALECLSTLEPDISVKLMTDEQRAWWESNKPTT